MMSRLGPLLADPERMRSLGKAAMDSLLNEPRTDPSLIAAVGYGTGGTMVLEPARSGVDFRGVATVNPVLNAGRPEDSPTIKCPVLVCVGSEDPLTPPEQLRDFAAEMTSANVDWQLNIYGGAKHAFHHPTMNTDGSLYNEGQDQQPVVVPGAGYHHLGAQRSWRAIIDLLDEVFRMPAAIDGASP